MHMATAVDFGNSLNSTLENDMGLAGGKRLYPIKDIIIYLVQSESGPGKLQRPRGLLVVTERQSLRPATGRS